jgi:Flp pilus assembly protein TadD
MAMASGNWPEAVSPLRTAVAINPRSALIQRTWGEVQVYTLADFDGGISSYRKAIGLGLEEPYVQMEIAHAQQMAAHDDDAIRTLDQAQLDLPLAHAIRGVIALKRTHVSEAVSELGIAVDGAPRNVWFLTDYGNALCQAGRATEAREMWSRALRAAPGFSAALHSKCYRP